MCPLPHVCGISPKQPKVPSHRCYRSCFSTFIAQNNLVYQFFPQKDCASFVSIAWEQRLITLGITKDAAGTCEDSWSFVTSSCFMLWFIFCSFLLALWFGILFCEMAALLRLCYPNTVRILNHVPRGVNEAVTQDLWKLLCLHFQGSMLWLISFLITWQDTHLKSEWKYSHCKYKSRHRISVQTRCTHTQRPPRKPPKDECSVVQYHSNECAHTVVAQTDEEI